MTPVPDLLVAAVSAIGAALLGYFVGHEKLRRERAFELRLKWHQDMVEAVHNFAYDLDLALKDEDAGDSVEGVREAWIAVRARQRHFVILAASSPLYSSPHVDMKLALLEGDVDEVTERTSRFTVIKAADRSSLRTLSDKLQRTAKPFAQEARRALAIK